MLRETAGAIPWTLAMGSTRQEERPEAGTGPGGPGLGEEAFRALYERTARPLRAYLRRLVSDPDLADDLLQEAYLRLLRLPRARLDALDEPQRGAYLYGIASRLAQDHWRRVQRERKHAERAPGGPPGAEPAADPAGTGADVSRAFATLAGRDRALLWLAHVEGRSHREIAGVLGLAAASVRVLLFRARRRLASRLAERGISPPRAGATETEVTT